MKHFDVVAAVILSGGRILCMQRGPGKNKETEFRYEFPGGKVEDGESMSAALMRELKEEMNLNVMIREEDLFLSTDYEYSDFSIRLNSFLVRAENISFTEKEHIGHRWMAPSEICSLDWAPADLPVALKIMKKGPELFQ